MSKPIDIDNKELVFYHRQKLIVKKLLKVSAEEIASIISQLVVENCNGCKTEHLSQTHHQCLTMERDERLCLYFDRALEKASETKVMESNQIKSNQLYFVRVVTSVQKNWYQREP